MKTLKEITLQASIIGIPVLMFVVILDTLFN